MRAMRYHSKHLGSDIAGKEDSARAASSPAAREMIEHVGASGVETLLDRLETQQPQCGFGLRGLCCSMCQWGPCRISDKSPRGVCGRGLEMVVVANMLRAVAAGCSAQTMHAHELILTLRGVARGEVPLKMEGALRLQDVGHVLNVARSWWSDEEVAEAVAEVMLDDLSRMTEGRMRSLMFAPKERREVWEELDLLPRSAAYEVVEAMHMTTMGGCSDWEALLMQTLRTALAYAYTGLVASSVLTDTLFGIPKPTVAKVDYGVLRPDHVNILVHGHSPVMTEKVLEKVGSPEIQELAREKGAGGIVVGGLCCTAHESLARHGIPAVAGVMGQELAVGTGAVDAVVVDMQCILPGLQAAAECFGTEIVTTYRGNRVPGATHIPFDPEHPETLDEDAERIVRMAVEAFERRDPADAHVPEHTTEVVAGFTREAVTDAFGGVKEMLVRLYEGEIRGIAAMVGCSTPKVPYEAGHVTIARELVREGVLVLASGCSAHALFGSGLCSPDAAAEAAPGLRAACEAAGVPPVLAMGACSDNARIIGVFAALAHEARVPLPQMPFVLSGPELANEKTMGQTLAVLAHGITAVVGLTPNLPMPTMGPTGEAAEAGSEPGHGPIADFFAGDGLHSLLGSRLFVQPDPSQAAKVILDEIDRRRELLGG